MIDRRSILVIVVLAPLGFTQQPKVGQALRLSINAPASETLAFRVESAMCSSKIAGSVDLKLLYIVTLKLQTTEPKPEVPVFTACFRQVAGSFKSGAEDFSFGEKAKAITSAQRLRLAADADIALYLLEQADKPFLLMIAPDSTIKDVKDVISNFDGSQAPADMCRSLIQPVLPIFSDQDVEMSSSWESSFPVPVKHFPFIAKPILGVEEVTSTLVRLSLAGKAVLDEARVAKIGEPMVRLALQHSKIKRADINGGYKVSRKDGFVTEGGGTLDALITVPPEAGIPEMTAKVSYKIKRVPAPKTP